MSVSPTEAALNQKLGDFLQLIVGATEVVQGLTNRVPTPAGAFVAFQVMNRHQLRTNISTYLDPHPTPGAGSRTVETGMKLLLQVDFYGPLAGDQVQQFIALWRDSYGCDALTPTCQPLYCDDGRQIPLTTGEEQYLQRWTVMAALQYNPLTSTSQQFAGEAEVTLIDVDVEYPQ